MGYFFGFELHLEVNGKGEILDFVITSGNVEDIDPLRNDFVLQKVFGNLFANKGCVGQKLFEQLFVNGINPITGIGGYIKNSLMSMNEKIMLRKRSIIETINGVLKNVYQAEHSRHRFFGNFLQISISGF